MIEELLGSVTGLGLAYIGINLIGIPDWISRELLHNPEKIKEYENKFKERKNSAFGFFEYYFTYLGRHSAYRTIDEIHKRLNKTE